MAEVSVKTLATAIAGAGLWDHMNSDAEPVEIEKILASTAQYDANWQAPNEDSLASLKINYNLVCKDTAVKNHVTAHLVLEDKTIIRTHLFSRQHEVSILAGKLAKGKIKNLKLFVDNTNADCELKNLRLEPNEIIPGPWAHHSNEKVDWDNLAKFYAPQIIVRMDQYQNDNTDMLLKMAYAVRDTKDGKDIVYQGYFSDEDSKTNSSQVSSQNGVWGRSLDIERVVIMKFDKKGKPLGMSYQAFLHLDRSGTYSKFEVGKFPTVYNMAANNIFSDLSNEAYEAVSRTAGRVVKGAYTTRRPPKLVIAYHPEVTEVIPYPIDRSELMLERGNEWMLEVSDKELRRENKLPNPATENLYVVFGGKMSSGRAFAELHIGDKRYSSGGNDYAVKKLGSDVWSQEAITAIPVSQEALAKIQTGHVDWHKALSLVQTSPSSDNKLEIKRVFTIKNTPEGYKAEKVFDNHTP